jgi:60 kDa SS-A/Ro ribonucleoprotein
MSYSKIVKEIEHDRTHTPQTRPIPGRGKDMVEMASGGYAFKLDEWQWLRRCLVIGTSSSTYYVNKKVLTHDYTDLLGRLLAIDGQLVVDKITDVSLGKRAPKNDHAVFALAYAIAKGDSDTRRYAYLAVPSVCRTGTHFLMLQNDLESLGVGWGKGRRAMSSDWYLGKGLGGAAFQALKYKNREGWTHRDVLRLAHTKPPTEEWNKLFGYITKGEYEDRMMGNGLDIIVAHERALVAKKSSEIIKLIADYKLPWEMLPTEFLRSPDVWQALLDNNLPAMAMIRNLGRMSNIELVKPLSAASRVIVNRLLDEDYIRGSGIHPFSVLTALRQYSTGKSQDHGRGVQMSWRPDNNIVSAMERAFVSAFGNVVPSGENFLLALDVSGSMGWNSTADGMAVSEAAAAMAKITIETEPWVEVVGFSDSVRELSLRKGMSLSEMLKTTSDMTMGGTDPSAAVEYAIKNKLDVDKIVMYSDGEGWAGKQHVCQALDRLRQKLGKRVKFVNCAMTPTGATLADPFDIGVIDVVGFDTSTPDVISHF